ncbi:hypothetical protein, partial [Streptomyces europaeiscabiei]|uniref:hypothetical protein n=1 Tax=Streptomyces europaeiscabiei TaxID=146819 RepID=UPI0029BEEB48
MSSPVDEASSCVTAAVSVGGVSAAVSPDVPGVSEAPAGALVLALIHISKPTRKAENSYAASCCKKKRKQNTEQT